MNIHVFEDLPKGTLANGFKEDVFTKQQFVPRYCSTNSSHWRCLHSKTERKQGREESVHVRMQASEYRHWNIQWINHLQTCIKYMYTFENSMYDCMQSFMHERLHAVWSRNVDVRLLSRTLPADTRKCVFLCFRYTRPQPYTHEHMWVSLQASHRLRRGWKDILLLALILPPSHFHLFLSKPIHLPACLTKGRVLHPPRAPISSARPFHFHLKHTTDVTVPPAPTNHVKYFKGRPAKCLFQTGTPPIHIISVWQILSFQNENPILIE